MKIEVHADHFKPDEQDVNWIAECCKRDWVVITGDKRIVRVPYNRDAAIKHKAKLFLLADTSTKGEEWAAAIIVGRRKMIRLAQFNDGPFYSNVGKATETHISEIRRILTAEELRPLKRRRKKPKKKTKARPATAAKPAKQESGWLSFPSPE
jgi:hypothetical protein